MENESFGKDLGLVHQVVVAGREIGMDHGVWAYLAISRRAIKKVVETVRELLQFSQEDFDNLGKWMSKMGIDFPVDDRESEYKNGSFSSYSEISRWFHDGKFCELFLKAPHNEAIRILCAEMECLFIIAYAYSSAYAEKHHLGTKFNTEPITGLLDVFPNLCDERNSLVQGARYLTCKDFLANESVIAIRSLAASVPRDEFNRFTEFNIDECLSICKSARDTQFNRVIKMIPPVAQ